MANSSSAISGGQDADASARPDQRRSPRGRETGGSVAGLAGEAMRSVDDPKLSMAQR
jgi:hypothetical protein